MHNKNKLIVISGCSGGGKSTLLSALARMGYATIPEVGREIVQEQLRLKGSIVPWEKPKEFSQLLIKRSIEAYQRAHQIHNAKNGIIFFDRSFIDGISWYQEKNGLGQDAYGYFMNELKFYPTVFMVPPWQEIFCQDEERKHTFADAVNEYNRLMLFYPKHGYNIQVIPIGSVEERINFLLSFLCEAAGK